MQGKRLMNTLRIALIPSSRKRTEFLKAKQVFGNIGNDCNIQSRKIPLYAELIRIGNNVIVASGVTFITHDVTHSMLNNISNIGKFKERIGCIEIGDNVFIGAGTTILYDVQIGSNVIIGADSLVNKDVPPNSVVAGAPARVICSFEDYVSRRKKECDYPKELAPKGEVINSDLVTWCWELFQKKHRK